MPKIENGLFQYIVWESLVRKKWVQLYYHCLMSSINLQGSNQGCHSFSISCSSTIIAWCHLLIFKAATRAATHFLFRAALLSLLDVIYWSSRQQPGLPLIFYFNIPWLFPDFSPFSRHFRRPPNSLYSCPQLSNLPTEHLLSENWTII